MRIDINSHRKVFAIQEEFRQFFPNLQILFYHKSYNLDFISNSTSIKEQNTTLACYTTTNHSGFISVSPEMTARELKQHFSDVFELIIDIFQKKNTNTWSEIPAKGSATLAQLNKEIFDE